MPGNLNTSTTTTSFAAATDVVAPGIALASVETVVSPTPAPTYLSTHWARALDEAFEPIFSAWSQPGTQMPNPTDLTRFDLISRMADSEDCWNAVRDRLETLPASVLKDMSGALARHLPASLSPLLYLAQHPDPEVRSRVVAAVSVSGLTRIAPMLLAVMEHVEDPSAREAWYDGLAGAWTGALAASVSSAHAIAFQIEWQKRHPGLGMSTDVMHRCIAAVSREARTLPRSPKASEIMARWLADTACQRIPYLAYDVSGGRRRVSLMTDFGRQANMEAAARLAAQTLANGNVRSQEALYETSVHISRMPERDTERERGVIPTWGAMLAAGALCMTEAGIPSEGCVDLDVAERFVRQCDNGGEPLRQILATSLLAHLLRRPADRPRAIGLIGDIVAVPPDEIRGNTRGGLTPELLLLLHSLGTDKFLDRPEVRRAYEAAAEIWVHVAVTVITWADSATLRRIAGAWRRKRQFPIVLEALIKRGVPVFNNDQVFRLTQSTLVDRTQAILAVSLSMDKEKEPQTAREPASNPAPRKI